MSSHCHRIVLMQFEEKTDGVEIARALHAGFDAIPGVRCIEAAAALTNRVESIPFTHASIFEFDHPDALTMYEKHPVHESARRKLHPRVRTFAVLDLFPTR